VVIRVDRGRPLQGVVGEGLTTTTCTRSSADTSSSNMQNTQSAQVWLCGNPQTSPESIPQPSENRPPIVPTPGNYESVSYMTPPSPHPTKTWHPTVHDRNARSAPEPYPLRTFVSESPIPSPKSPLPPNPNRPTPYSRRTCPQTIQRSSQSMGPGDTYQHLLVYIVFIIEN
jgi:hypothetical protein